PVAVREEAPAPTATLRQRTTPRATLAQDDESAPIAPPAAKVPEPAAPVPSAPLSLSATELFAAANRARFGGDAALAIRLSRELEGRFPESPEAITTHLSLGLLYLQQDAAADALLEFRRYRAVGSLSTMPEALWGESRALRLLGHAAEERVVLQELL